MIVSKNLFIKLLILYLDFSFLKYTYISIIGFGNRLAPFLKPALLKLFLNLKQVLVAQPNKSHFLKKKKYTSLLEGFQRIMAFLWRTLVSDIIVLINACDTLQLDTQTGNRNRNPWIYYRSSPCTPISTANQSFFLTITTGKRALKIRNERNKIDTRAFVSHN